MKNLLETPLSRRAVLAGLALTPFGIAGCSSGTSTQGSSAATTETVSDGLTMFTANRNYQEFSEALTAKYPDVSLKMVSYAGANTTDYIKAQMEAEQCLDIAVNTFSNVPELQINNLYDISGEDFTNNVRTALLDDVSVDGAIYLLPSTLQFLAPYYNATLFEKHGWSVPNSFTELEELVPKIKEAGVKVAEVTSLSPGFGFSVFFNLNAGDFFNTLEGKQWISDFLAGNATAAGNLEGCAAYIKQFLDLGIFDDIDPNLTQDTEARDRYADGNTAFLVTTGAQTFEGSTDTHKLIPWLSADGSANTVITNVDRFYGINKNLADDPDRLEKALKVLDFLASDEGQATLISNESTISPAKNTALSDDSPVHDVAALVDEGKSMAMVYSGWEDYVVDFGNQMLKVLRKEESTDTLIPKLDELQKGVLAEEANAGITVYAETTEDLEPAKVAQIVGAAYAEAVGADCALVSLGDFHDFGKENGDGVNGYLYAGVDVDEAIVCTVNPLSWAKVINTMQLDGKTIKAWVDEGYYRSGDSEPFEYVLVTKDGVELDDATTYTVALATESEERQAEHEMTETEFTGQNAIIDYVTKLGELNSETIVWK